MSEMLLNELDATLHAPSLMSRHGRSDEDILVFVQAMRGIAIVVAGARSVSVPALEARDPDVALIVAAVEGEADCIVSQDPDLLDLGRFEQIDIIEPLAFLRQLRALS